VPELVRRPLHAGELQQFRDGPMPVRHAGFQKPAGGPSL
jgi:hypothetical protein